MLICIWKVDDGHNPPTSIERAESLAIQAAKEMVEVTKEIATSYELGDKVGLHGGIAAGDLVYIDLPYTNHGAQGGRSCFCVADMFQIDEVRAYRKIH